MHTTEDYFFYHKWLLSEHSFDENNNVDQETITLKPQHIQVSIQLARQYLNRKNQVDINVIIQTVIKVIQKMVL